MTASLLLVVTVSQLLTLCWGELYCSDYLVSGLQGVPDSAMSASSVYEFNGHHHNPACGRLNMYTERTSKGCPTPNIAAWCGLYGDSGPHIQVKFSNLKNIVGVVLQQRSLANGPHGNDILTYHVLHSTDGEEWDHVTLNGLKQTFYGPTNNELNSMEYGDISPPIKAQYIRIKPLTWVTGTPTPPCLRFDVLGCTHDTGRRRFAYLPLPPGSISVSDMITEEHAKDLRECSIQCHRDVTCRSFSYSDTYKQCRTYNVNKYTRLKSGVDDKISDKQYLYYFDMTLLDLHMITDPQTGLIYKVMTRKYNKTDAMAACADFQMRLFVVNSLEKLHFLQRVTSSNLILDQRPLRVNGGWYMFNGVSKWWDGGNPPLPVREELVKWDTANKGQYDCLSYKRNAFRKNLCTAMQLPICEI